MEREKIIYSLNTLTELDYHFTEYESKNEISDIVINSERRNNLLKEYFYFIDALKQEILENKTLEEINLFIEHKTLSINPKMFYKEEYQLLLLKINEISHWFYKNNFPLNYYNKTHDRVSHIP